MELFLLLKCSLRKKMALVMMGCLLSKGDSFSVFSQNICVPSG